MNDYSGFSLIELLITLTVLSIVLAVGAYQSTYHYPDNKIHVVSPVKPKGNRTISGSYLERV